jgi:hypothetical protein
MNKIKAVALVASAAALLTTALSGVASAHISPPATLPANTNLMVCTNHGIADIVITGPQHRTVQAVGRPAVGATPAVPGCQLFQNIQEGDYVIGSQEEKEEEPAPCRAQADADPTHAGYPLCFGYGYFTHHIEVDRPGSVQFPGAKFEPPTADVRVTPITDGTAPTPGAPPTLGEKFCDPTEVSITALTAAGYTVVDATNTPITGFPAAYTGPYTCTHHVGIPAVGTTPANPAGGAGDLVDPLGILPGKVLNFTVVILHMHQAYGHI